MPDLPSLTVADVRNWTVDRYYDRGEGYFRDGRIHSTRREGRTLKALCRGSQPNPYRVEVTLDNDGIASGSCSCPIGGDGRCKHAVALLLTWVKQPEAFECKEPLDTRLQAQSADILIDIIHRLLERDPALKPVVEFQLDSQDVNTTVDVRDYVEQAFEVRGFDPYDHGYAREVAENLDPLLDRGHEHLASEDWTPAITLFQTVAETVCEQFDTLHDEQGHLISVIDTCGEGLGDVLAAADDQALRSHALEALLDICVWNAENGGYGASDAAGTALRKHTTAEERRRAADVLRQNLPLPPNEDAPEESVLGRPTRWDHHDWTRRSLGRLLLDLEGDRLDAASYLNLCRRTGHWKELIDRLLKLDRLDEAADAAAQYLPDYSLTDVADRLVKNGADENARSLLDTRLDEGRPSPNLLRWLYEHALDAEDYETALTDARRLFRSQPSIETYEQVRRAAEPLDKWTTVRAELLDALDQSPRQDLLVELYLHEGDPDTALELIEPFAGEDRSWAFGTSFLVSVADAVVDTHPDAAVALYEESARDLIDQRGRSNYADAADILTRAKHVYEATDAFDRWDNTLDSLYDEELRRLPAARDEFEKAGLM